MCLLTRVYGMVCAERSVYQVSIKVKGTREMSAAEMFHWTAVHHKVVHSWCLRRQTVRLLSRVTDH